MAVGSKVRVLDLAENVEEVYQIVGGQEANPMQGRISDESPFGRGLLGHMEGEEVTVEAPMGVLRFRIIGIEN